MSQTKNVKLSNIQLGLLLYGFLYGSTAILNPAVGAGRDSWLAVILGSLIGLTLLLMYAKISMLNPDKTLVEILQNNFGKVLGTMVSVLYIWYFLHLGSLLMRNFGEFLTTTSYPETPMSVIMVMFTICVVYTLKSGLEVAGRVSELIVPFIPIVVVTACTAMISLRNFMIFEPVLENGFGPVLLAGYRLSTFPFGEAVAFMMIFPYVNKREKVTRTVFISVLAIGLTFLIIVTRDTIILGPSFLKNIIYAPDITTRLIPEISIEPVIDVNLLIGGGIKAILCLYVAVKGTAQLLHINDHRPLVTAFSVFALVLAAWLYTNSLDMLRWAKDIWPLYSIPFQYVFPTLLFIISWGKNRKGSKQSTEKC